MVLITGPSRTADIEQQPGPRSPRAGEDSGSCGRVKITLPPIPLNRLAAFLIWPEYIAIMKSMDVSIVEAKNRLPELILR